MPPLHPKLEPGVPERNVSQALTLAVFLALVPTVLLVALARSTVLNVHWHSDGFRIFLFLCSAALSALIARWIHVEAMRGQHPAVMLLAVGFAGESLIFTAMAAVPDVPYLPWAGVFSVTWAVIFAGCGVVLIEWTALRRRCRSFLLGFPGGYWAAGALLFSITLAIWLQFARIGISNARSLEDMRSRSGLVALVLVVLVTLYSLRLYLERRTAVILSFTLALYIFALALTARLTTSAWHVIWWYGHTLNFVSLFLVAYGVLEGYRAGERDSLIRELGALSKRLEEQSLRDPLTGCYNRRYALDILDSEFRKAQRSRLPLTLLIADADDFKAINDTYGHPFGDFVLQELALRLRDSVRTSDVLARCGGEEFFVILPQANRMGGQEVAQKLLDAVRSRPFEHEGREVRLTASVGIADTLSTGVTDVATLIEAADRALYSAKNSGKDRAVTLDPLAFSVPGLT